MPSPETYLAFAKMHGCGNDYVVLEADPAGATGAELRSLARRICHRREGVGADGVLLVGPKGDPPGSLRMRMWNPDGTEAEMCGNGLRCAALFAWTRGLTRERRILFHTRAGDRPVDILEVDGSEGMVRTGLGAPSGAVETASLEREGHTFEAALVQLGNPHAVVFVPGDLQDYPVEQHGPLIETHPRFPGRTNVEFVAVLDRGTLQQRTWERGAGETAACGTGAGAACVAAAATGRANRRVAVLLAGGRLEVEWSELEGVQVTGPAVEVFTGHLPR